MKSNNEEWVDRECKWCKRTFSVKIASIKRGFGYFCSNRCIALFRWNSKKARKDGFNTFIETSMSNRTCKYCNSKFKVKTTYLKTGKHTGKYCSKQCYRLDQPMTEPERIMAELITELGFTFMREFPVKDTSSRYNKYKYIDFYIHRLNLAIEVYGEYWHSLPGSHKKDRIKQALITRSGHQLLVVWENDLLSNLEGVKKALSKCVKECLSLVDENTLNT